MRNGIFTMHIGVIAVFILAVFPVRAEAEGLVYTVKSRVNLRSGPGTSYASAGLLDHNQTLVPLSKSGGWQKVRTVSGIGGFVRSDMLSDRWIRIYKKERRLDLMRGRKSLAHFKMALCPRNPLGDKFQLGDGGTPEGRFFICELIKNPRQAKYGARSMRLSYPNIEDARRGLKDGLINTAAYFGIVKSIRNGKMPNQSTKLGGSIRIHGGGSESDWTLGCVALADRDAISVFDHAGLGTRVDIYKSEAAAKTLNAPGYMSRKILKGSRNQLKNPALYTSEATAIIKLEYPFGDIDPNQAVCTDIIVRALRHAGVDLQAALYEDARMRPNRYKKWIEQPNWHIDHRRTRNLDTYFKHHAEILPNKPAASGRDRFLPGDIVLMDTGIRNGTVFDHIGILDNTNDDQGLPNVINIWTVGFRTESMDLLGNGYPEVVGRFRMGHPFDY